MITVDHWPDELAQVAAADITTLADPEILRRRRDAFRQNWRVLERIRPLVWSRDTQRVLQSAYSRTMLTVRKRARRLALATCPYCGSPDSVTQLDHYLPRDSYPEYSAFSENIVPCCASCNNAKGTLAPVNGLRPVANPFNDKALALATFECAIVAFGAVFEFELLIRDVFSADDSELLRRHVENLRLKERFARAAMLEYRTLCATYGVRGNETARHLSPEEVSEELQRRAHGIEITSGRNHWWAVLYRALAANRRAIEAIKSTI